MSAYFVRMRFGPGGEDLTREVWETGHVGLWHGDWTPDSLPDSRDPAARCFVGLTPGDSVLTVFDGAIHCAQIDGPLELAPPEFKRHGERFKWRRLGNRNSFTLAHLPDSFRLLQTAGRGAINRLDTYGRLAEMLTQERDAAGIKRRFSALFDDDFGVWISLLGPKGWESLALAYLIIEKEYVPTGLVVGRTLKDLDIVGANRKTHNRILAQCKNTHAPLGGPPPEFVAATQATGDGRDTDAFLFAFGGCKNADRVCTVVTGSDLNRWLLESEKGRCYRQLVAPQA
ncbi:MAG: hypothetical protein ACRD13_14415 [Terriglobales bacterium]